MSFECIRFETGEGIARIFFNRPERLNAFNLQMLQELRTVLDQCAEDPQIRVILITGTGRGFCAGQDLTERKNEDGELELESIHSYSSKDDIVEETGFKLKIPHKTNKTIVPTEEEIKILEEIDPNGTRFVEFESF